MPCKHYLGTFGFLTCGDFSISLLKFCGAGLSMRDSGVLTSVSPCHLTCRVVSFTNDGTHVFRK